MSNDTPQNIDEHSADLTRLEHLLQRIITLLGSPVTSIQVGGDAHDSVLVVGDNNTIIQVSRDEIELLDSLQANANSAQREQIYLARVVLSEICAPWERLYVPLSGRMDIRQALEGLPSVFFEFVAPLEGQPAQTTMKPLKDITEAIQNHPAFIILGAPGSGKSTTQLKIAYDAARSIQTGPAGATRIPIFVRLSDQRDQDPYTFLKTEWERRVGTSFDTALKAGRILLLADGVNEIPRQDRAGRFKAWRNFISDYRGSNRLIFSGRFLDYAGELELPRVLVEPLDKDRIGDFLKRHQAEGLAKLLESPHSKLLALADNPLNLLILTVVYRQNPNQSFENRGKLFCAFTDSLLYMENRDHPTQLPTQAVRQALAQLAFSMQEQGEGLTFALDTARKALPAKLELDDETVEIDSRSLFDFGRGATLLDPERKPEVRFRHHVLQEYFAALDLQRRFDLGQDLSRLWRVKRSQAEMPPTAKGDWDPLPEPPSSGWEVTTILACGLSQAPEKLIEAVRQTNPALAARCLDEAGIEKPTAVTASTRADLLTDLTNPLMHLRTRLQAGTLLGKIGDPRFEKQSIGSVQLILPEMLPVPAGEYLMGSQQDEKDTYEDEYPRHTVTVPAFALGKWPVTNAEYACFMAAGGYQNEALWEGELSKRWLKGEEVAGGQFKSWLDVWKILKTWDNVRENLEQRGTFTPAQVDSYVYVASLTEEKLKEVVSRQLSQKSRTQPANWHDPLYNNPSQPVVGITWFEARAYCAWLTAVTGKPYRLPTEAEWEAAARGLPASPDRSGAGGEVRTYPWGNDWDKEKANTIEGRVMKPAPVGAYACAGAVGPFGAEDQSGNVYNWTSSLYLPYPYDPAKSELTEDQGQRTLRGGSWYDLSRNARCAYRDRYFPDFFNLSIGFRCVVSLAIPEF
ncbi:MAG: SUMF1/EgtB/PvdO family nonheme iron enzyme [Chloroflexota bacterium]